MAYPISVDTFTVLTGTDDILASHQNQRGSSITAIQNKLGINYSAVTTSIDYRLRNHNHAGSPNGVVIPVSTGLSGSITSVRLGSMPASRVSWGSIPSLRIGSMPASRVSWGSIPSTRIGSVPATRVTWGSIGSDRIPEKSTADFKTGDWILSTVTTARTGWTNVSTTYANKFIRISTAGLSTGGADTHSHTLAEANLQSHSHAAGTLTGGAHTHDIEYEGYLNGGTAVWLTTTGFPRDKNASTQGVQWNTQGSIRAKSNGAVTVTGTTGAIGSGTAMTGDNVPAYVTVVIFQKN